MKARPKDKKKKDKNKEEDSQKFYKELIKSRERNEKTIQPRIYYEKEYDMFYMWFGGNSRVKYTIETNWDMRFDINQNNNIVAVEIEDFSKYLNKKDFNKILKEQKQINKKKK